jgi:siroheme synthase
MGLRNIEAIAAALMGGGLPVDTPVAVIASATLPQERAIVSSLATIAADARAADLESPAVIVIGHIVKTRQWLLEAFSQAQSPILNNGSDPSVAAPKRQPCES